MFCFTHGHAEPLYQYNDDATSPYRLLWGSLFLVFLPGIPLTTLIAIRALVLAFRPPRTRLVVSSLLVIGASSTSWYALTQNFLMT